MAVNAGAAQFAQENFSEYHLYTLGRRTSIQNNESKQISLLTGTNIPVEKYLQVEGQPYYYRNPQGIGNAIPQPVKVFYRFKNEEKAGLGMPLPAGTVRVYQADSQAARNLRAKTTSTTRLRTKRCEFTWATHSTWSASASRWITRRLRYDLYEMEYQITLRNHKTAR